MDADGENKPLKRNTNISNKHIKNFVRSADSVYRSVDYERWPRHDNRHWLASNSIEGIFLCMNNNNKLVEYLHLL